MKVSVNAFMDEEAAEQLNKAQAFKNQIPSSTNKQSINSLDNFDEQEMEAILAIKEDDSIFEVKSKKNKGVGFKFSRKRPLSEIEGGQDDNQEQILALITQSNKVTQSLYSGQDTNNYTGPTNILQEKSQESSASALLNGVKSNKQSLDDLCIDFSQIAVQANQ